MKIAFYSYPPAFQNPGGGEVQLLKTKEALEKKGVAVKFFNQWDDKLEDFDILHIFGSVKDCIGLMQTAKNKGVKIALSTIFWSSFKRALHESRDIRIKANLCMRHLAKLFFPEFPSGRRKTMSLSDILLPNSEAEAKQLRRLFYMRPEKISVVPNGVDERFKNRDTRAFTDKYGFKNFALAVGRIEPRKNQLNLIKAMNKINKDLVIIGSPVSDYMDYYELCRKAAGDNIHFLANIGHEEPLLASAYACCDVFVAPGWFETPALAALEAGLSGTRMAVTKHGCTKDYFLDMVEYFDPSNIDDIIKAVLSAYGKDNKKDLRNHIYKNYTWDKVADATISAYKKVSGGDI